jgi:heme exporter protein D
MKNPSFDPILAVFPDMGGYGAYVWPAFAIAALVLIGLLMQSLVSARRNEAEAAALRAERAAALEAAQPREAGHGA